MAPSSGTVVASPRSAGSWITSGARQVWCFGESSLKLRVSHQLPNLTLLIRPSILAALIDKTVPKHDLMACNTLCLPFNPKQVSAAGRSVRAAFLRGFFSRPYRSGFPRGFKAPFSRGCSNGEGHGQVVL